MQNLRQAEEADPTLQYLRKIPSFEGLTLPEIQALFGICRLQQYASDRTLYETGDPSDSLLILLEGTLSVRTSAGVELSQILPVGLVGEMGILTGEPRSAHVVTVEPVMGLLINHDDLQTLWSHNGEICRKMLLNVIRNLSRKLHSANQQMEHLKRNVPGVSKELEELMAGNVFLN